MFATAARSLRTVERFLLVPPLTAEFASLRVVVSDISSAGARFRHDHPLETGHKGLLRLQMDGHSNPIALEGVVVWSQHDGSGPGRFVSGARTWGSPEVVRELESQLHTSKRSNRIEELRGSDRFSIEPPLAGTFSGEDISIENLSARGAGIVTARRLAPGTAALLQFRVPSSDLEAKIEATVAWTRLKAIVDEQNTWRSGLNINTRPETMRLAIALLTEQKRAAFDTHSLALKLKIIHARARQLAPTYRGIETSGVPAEQYVLIQAVREELRLNPEQAMHWYRRARQVINDPKTRQLAPTIADYPDALAVWEYLDRSIDPSLVGRAFEIK